MEEIPSKTAAFSADATIDAMINTFIGVIVPKFANITVIPSSPFAAPYTELPSSLRTATNHTKHVFSLLPNQDVILNLIVT